MIKAIIFDCFGVLVTGSLENYADAFLGDDSEKRKQAYHFNDQANAGYMSYDELIQQYAKLADADVNDVAAVINDNPKNARLLTYIGEGLKPSYKIGFLSNAAGDLLPQLFDKEEANLFDTVVLSFDVGMVKPDARIYELAASRLGIAPEECVFIDDNERFCTGARETGMEAIHYKNFPQMKAELEALLEMPNPDK